MNRRQAIGFGAAAAVAIPAGLIWWNKLKIGDSSFLNENRQAILEAAVDAIIPETRTPGAKSLGVDRFVVKIVQDCLTADQSIAFSDALVELDKAAKRQYSSAFKLLSPAERIEVLKTYPTEDEFINLLKSLTIRGYNTSEYVMTNVQNFEFIPGRYLGCVNLNKESNA